MLSNITEITSNTTHTVEEWNKRSMLVLSSGCTICRLVGGTGADESNRIVVQNIGKVQNGSSNGSCCHLVMN